MAPPPSTPQAPSSSPPGASPAGAAPEPLSPGPHRPWLGRLGYLGGALLGAVLLLAAYAKAIDPVAFAQQIRGEGLAPFGPPFAWAVGMIALEVGLGIALLLNLRRRAVLWVATLLVALFLFLTARTYWRTIHGEVSAADAASCGCFGNLVERSPAEAFWQDLLMLAPALGLAWLGRPRTTAGTALHGAHWRTAAGGVAGVSALAAGGFAWFAPVLPLDDLATRLAPGTSISTLCAGSGDQRICLDTLVPGLGTGSRWVVLADVRAAEFPAQAEALNRYVQRAAAESLPGVAVLADLTQEEQMELFWRLAPAFDLHEVPLAVLRPLYRQLPRTFFVEEGRVTRTYPGLAPEIGSAAAPNHRKTDDPQP